jgi:hypothetical protein
MGFLDLATIGGFGPAGLKVGKKIRRQLDIIPEKGATSLEKIAFRYPHTQNRLP